MRLIPVTGNQLEDTLREYEAAHQEWMDTSVFAPNADRVRQRKDEARAKYTAAARAAHPDWIVI